MKASTGKKWLRLSIISLFFASFLLSSVQAQMKQVHNSNYCIEAKDTAKIMVNTDFSYRAKEIVSYWSEKTPQGKPQHKIYQAIAAYEVGKVNLANQIVDSVILLNYENYAEAHIGAFIAMPLTYAYMRYGELMGKKRQTLLVKKVKSFDPFTGASENHKLLNISSAYILAQSTPKLDWLDYSNQEVYQKARSFLEHEAQNIFKHGLWEFDSSNYIIFHINSWLLIHDFAADKELRKLAQFTLDLIFAGIAPETIDGTWAASTSRTYTPSNANYRDRKGNVAFTWLAFGHQRKSMGEPRINILAVSNYRLPEEIIASAVARDESVLPYEHVEKHSRVKSGKYPFYKYSWIDKGYGIYSTYDGNEVIDFTTGQYHKWGIAWNDGYFVLKDLNRQQAEKGFLTGDSSYNQVFQYQNTVVGVTVKPEEITRHEQNITQTVYSQGWEFMLGGDSVYIAFYNVNDRQAWIIETFPKDSFDSLPTFAAHIISHTEIDLDRIQNALPGFSYKNSKGNKINITYQNDHSYINQEHKIDGKAVDYQARPALSNPWMSLNQDKKELTLTNNEIAKKYNFKSLNMKTQCVDN